MHKYNKIIISCAATILALCSCSSGDEYNRNATGRITLDVETDKTITQSVVSRATTPSMPVLNSLTPDKLTLSLTNKSGTYSHTWSSHNEFPEEEEFPADTYTMTASYGNTDAEGFESPQLYGEVSFPVIAGKVTPVKLTATVANSLIMFEPTEKFLNYFQSARFVLNTTAGNSLVVNPGETRPVYINPGNARIDARVVMPSGTDALITIGYFTAKKATLHRIALDVDASTGTATLTIRFDETFPDVEPITIDLTKDLESLVPLPIPVITPEGFEGSRAVDLRETYSDDYAFNIATRAGLASATLSVTDDGNEPQVYNLLDDKDAAALANKGLRTLNLKPGCEFSKIYLKDFVASLRCKSRDTDSSKAITICVKDSLGHTTDETLADNNTFKVNLSPVTFSIEAVKDVIVHPTYQVKVTYNGRDIEKWMKFNTISKTGTKSDANPVKIESGTTEDEYLCTFNTPRLTPYFIVRGGIDEDIYQKDEIFVPQFRPSIPDRDKWATHATLTIMPDSAAKYGELIAQNIKLSGLSESQINTTTDPMKYELTGLTPGQQHTIQSSLNGLNLQSSTFTTEEALQLPDNGFDNWTSDKKGDYQYLWTVNNGASWATMNELTVSQFGSGSSSGLNCDGAAYKATSGTIPANGRSTKSQDNGGNIGTETSGDGHTANNANLHSDKSYSGTNAALIRTVGWNKDNAAKGIVGNRWNKPQDNAGFGTCKNMTPGQLYLGKYNTSTNQPEYGYSFPSRPLAISFYYHYDVVSSGNGDYGTVKIEIYDTDNNIIASADDKLTEQAAYTKKTLVLSYIPDAPKAARVSVIFISSANKDALSEDTKFWRTPGHNNISGGEYVGSELYIDDIQLIY